MSDEDLEDIASDLFVDLCEGDGGQSEQLDKALILKHLRRAVHMGERERGHMTTQRDAALQRLRDLPRYAFDQDGSIYGPVDAGPGTFILDEDFTEVLAIVLPQADIQE